MENKLIFVSLFVFILATISLKTFSVIYAKEKPKFQMVVMSDIHIEGKGHSTTKKFQDALQDMKKVAPDYNVISIVGDLTNWGTEEEYDVFNHILNKEKGKNAETIFAIGNHEYYENLKEEIITTNDQQMQQRFIDKMNVPNIYYNKWIEGYHFIVLAGEKGPKTLSETAKTEEEKGYAYISEKQYQWFEKTLKIGATKEKPIFVFLHQPIANTVHGSEWNAGFNEQRLLKILQKYPQTIFFTGHSHYPINHEDSIILNKTTLVNTGSVKYVFDGKKIVPKLSQGYLINIFNDRVEIKGREFSTKSWIRNFIVPLKHETWEKENGKWFYYNKNEEKIKGWIIYNGEWFFLNSKGVMETGWVKYKNNWYFLSPYGNMKIGWLYDNENWYYLNSNGSMKTGWLKENNQWYYLKSNGSMAKGWKYIDKRWYYFNSNGSWNG